MGTVKVGGTKFDIPKYDGRSNYLLWEKQVKGALRAYGLGKVLKSRREGVKEEDWNDVQEQAVSTVILYL
jgi:hypothetical protein